MGTGAAVSDGWICAPIASRMAPVMTRVSSSCTERRSVTSRSYMSDQVIVPSRTSTRRAVTRRRLPSRWTVPSSCRVTPSSRPTSLGDRPAVSSAAARDGETTCTPGTRDSAEASSLVIPSAR